MPLITLSSTSLLIETLSWFKHKVPSDPKHVAWSTSNHYCSQSRIPRHRGTSSPDASRESLRSFPAHDVHWWWWHHWRRQNLWLPHWMWPLPIKMGLEHVGTCWNQAKSGALTRCTHQNHIWTVFKPKKWLRIHQQNEGTTIALSRYWLLICYWMGVKWCMQHHATSQYLAINRVAMHLGRVM